MLTYFFDGLYLYLKLDYPVK